LSFDPDTIKVQEVIAGDIIEHSAANFGTIINNEEGTIKLVFSDEIDLGLINADGEFAKIKATINETENIGFSPIELVEEKFTDANLNPVIVTFNGGGVNVKEIEKTPTPDPTQEPTPEPTPEETSEPTSEVENDFTRPVVEIRTNADVLNVDNEVTIKLIAHDDVGVVDRLIKINDTPIDLNESDETKYSSDSPGAFKIVAYAYDEAGNEGYSSKEIRFIEAGDTKPPVVEIISPESDSKLTLPTEIKGTASDENLTMYKLEYSKNRTERKYNNI